MVCRRKQLKPSGAKGDRPEAALTLPDKRSPLVALPTEIQGIITNYLVQLRDLNHLCCTCKTLTAIVLPTLYHTVELKVPLRCSRLPSLENLLASSSEGLKYTRCLKIATKQYSREDESYTNLNGIFKADDEDVVGNEHASGDEDEASEAESNDDEEEEEEGGGEEDVGLFRIYHPDDQASNALNAFTRVLILKFAPQQLNTFWWEHACPLNMLTLSLVLKHQGPSVHALNFGQCAGTWKNADLARLTMGNLKTLNIGELAICGPLASELLAKNYQNVRHLGLGSEVDLAADYANDGFLDNNEIGSFQRTDDFAELMKKKVAALNEPSTPVVQLESLSLIGLDLFAFLNGSIEPVIDFNSLSTLKLESCACLAGALHHFTASETGRRKAKSPQPKSALRLHTLAIRHEKTSHAFLRELQHFLLSLKPLTHLHVLLEGSHTKAIKMNRVLRVHGNCLRSFVWDERDGPRIDVREDTTIIQDDYETLRLVAKYCPGLIALGISLDWDDITESEENHKKVASSFSQLSQLQTLNIRNLPAASAPKNCLTNDYMMDGLATMLLNLITKKARIEPAPALKTLAIGASTYGNIRMGSHYTRNSASTFLQLRIYHVNYDCRYRNSPSPKLHLIASGTPTDAQGDAEHLDIFTLYWLDGAPLDPGVGA